MLVVDERVREIFGGGSIQNEYMSTTIGSLCVISYNEKCFDKPNKPELARLKRTCHQQ